MDSLTLVPQPLASWLKPSLQDTAGRDPLGLNTITLDRVLPQLMPGVLQLSERARYFSIYPWMLWLFAERKRPPQRDVLDRFITRREYELCLAMKLCKHCAAFKAIGGNSAGPRITAGEDPLARGRSVDSNNGGFGLYYRGPLMEFGAVAPVGTPIASEGAATPIEVLLRNDRAMRVANAFHAAIEDTEYFRNYERTDEPIPRHVLEDLADRICLCQLPYASEERDAIRELLFTPPTEAAAEACAARRQGFALFLSLLDADPDVAEHAGAFWRGLIGRFEEQPTADDHYGRTLAPWAALAMKECVQDALCSVWTEFCRAGIQQQGLDGMSQDELEAMVRHLAADPALDILGTTQSVSPDDATQTVLDRALVATAGAGWDELRAWAAEQNTALAGVVALLVLADRTPDPHSVHGLWGEIAQRRSEHQSGLLGVVSAIQRHLRDAPTLGETLHWTVRRFLIGPHEAIAYSKLPKATFRFAWEDTGRLRFFTPGGGGLGRFQPSDDRRGTMALLSRDVGFWEKDQDDRARLTADGRAFVAEVLGR